ncbi:hypothetical protein ACQEWB_32835 [Streptomyces sp. CA-249302]|uniref:hypothetical protein n=1 Tax=Streptomyces sp. CA-249302 TaxID=3240058 RepID=UPI003D8C2295
MSRPDREAAKTAREKNQPTPLARSDPDTGPGSLSQPTRTPLPVRRPLPRREPAPASAAPPGLLSMLTAEELAAEQPSIETLRRVRKALRSLPEPE